MWQRASGVLQGEITLVVEGQYSSHDQATLDAKRVLDQQFIEDLMELNVPASAAARMAAKHLGASKRQMYEYASEVKART